MCNDDQKVALMWNAWFDQVTMKSSCQYWIYQKACYQFERKWRPWFNCIATFFISHLGNNLKWDMGCNTFISAVNVCHIVKNYGSCSILTFVSVSEHVKNVSTLVITYAMREDREMCLTNSVIIPTPCDLFGIRKDMNFFANRQKTTQKLARC